MVSVSMEFIFEMQGDIKVSDRRLQNTMVG